MKTYYRGERGDFITAAEWFAQKPELHVDSVADLMRAGKALTRMHAEAGTYRTTATLAILGAASISEYGGERNYITMRCQPNGCVNLWYSSNTTGGSRADILARVLADIDRLIAIQTEHAERAASGSVDDGK